MDNPTITGGSPTEHELELINKLARRPLTADETYVFSVVLCDNEVDRDNERFDTAALYSLAKLFVGKTGIFDHSMQGRDQCARIFDCAVVSDSAIKTSTGETYHYLKASAYMPRTESNRDLLLEIDAGIKKEVSVGCATAGRTCSVCGADLRRFPCGHIKGKMYKHGGKTEKCYTILSQPTDAYEWSFVAVPAQVCAGVTKQFEGEEAAPHIDRTELEGKICRALMLKNADGYAKKVFDYVRDKLDDSELEELGKILSASKAVESCAEYMMD